MGLRGPAPSPANLHVIKGNPSKIPASRLNDALRPKVEIPDCPDFLLPDAQTEWHRIAPELKKLHIISAIDMAALAMYCQTYAQWAAAQKKIKEYGEDGLVDITPSGFRQLSAWYIVSTKAHEQMRSMLAEFGLSPSSRSRISANVCTNLDIFDDSPQITNPAEAQPEAKPSGPSRFFKT